MVLLGVVRFVKDEQVDLVNGNEGMRQAMVQNGCSTNDHLIILEVFIPGLSCPQIGVHLARESIRRLVQVGFEYTMLLINQGYLVYLFYTLVIVQALRLRRFYQKERDSGLASCSTIF